jgi:aminoglycoside 3-N-acetyltransferase
MKTLLENLGLKANDHVLVHTSFKAIKKAFKDISMNEFITILQDIITSHGSILMPAFSYCFKAKHPICIFDRDQTPSRTGAVSEVFRNRPHVIRTSSPTHSFSLWGNVTKNIPYDNAPSSPLGEESALDWLVHQQNSKILMLGVDFTAMTFCHYLEIKSKLPWSHIFPFRHRGYQPIGLSIQGDQKLSNVPGCSRAFKNFETNLLKLKRLKPVFKNGLKTYLIPIQKLYKDGMEYFIKFPETLLCQPGTCKTCDERRIEYILTVHKLF